MAETFGDVIQTPGTKQIAEVKPGDIWYSKTGSELIKGGTMKKVGAGGTIAAGTLVAFETATKKYVAYADGGSGGAEVADGVLLESTNTVGGDTLVNIVFGKATLKNDKLIGVDANGIADLKARVDTDRNMFIF